MRENSLTMTAPGDNPPCDAHRLPFLLSLGKKRHGLRRLMRPIKAVGERRYATRDESVELIAPRLHHKIQVVPLVGLLFLAHEFPPGVAAPNCLRYSSMNGSIAPSITFCTSLIFSSVR